jgi:YYY domain-containing protein
VSEALRFLVVVEVIGLLALPLTALVLGRLPGRGLAWSKPLGLLAAAYPAWLIAHTGLIGFGTPLALLGVVGVGAGGLVLLRRRGHSGLPPGETVDPGRPPSGGSHAWRRLPPPVLSALDRRLLIGAEATFAAAFAGFAVVRAYAADVRGTEAPMDMAFLAATHAGGSFPPPDPWLAGEELNYYYFGHYLMAFVVRLAGVAPDEGYNLALALLFALCAVAAFALVSGLTSAAGGRRPVLAGAAGVLTLCVLGNVDAARAVLEADGPLTEYPWFEPARVIPGAITEFPAFSFLLGDLHAHVLAIPFTLLALAFALQAVLSGPRARHLVPAGVAVGALYAMNAWSYPVGLGLVLAAVAVGWRQPGRVGSRRRAVGWAGGTAAVSVLAFLPFWLTFEPPDGGGLALVPERRSFSLFARDQILTLGVFGWVLLGAYGERLLATRRPARTAAWALVGAMVGGSLLAALDDLAGVALLAAAIAVAIHAALERPLAVERFVWLLVAAGLSCVALPEVVYLRDEFDGSDLYRMNTVFKFGYQAWILLAVVAAVLLPWARARLPATAWRVWAPIAVIGLGATALYPLVGAYARTAAFADGPRVAGDGWLAREAPGDVAAIAYLRARTPPDTVILESVGEDYSAFGHARISTFSGRSAVLGWAGHERQWGHDPGRREADVRRLYRTETLADARELLDRYEVDYVVVGPLERADHGDGGLAKFAALGRRVLERDGTTLWDVRRRP